MLYAQVIVDITTDKLDKPFQYLIPEHLKEVLRIGMEVIVPFGAGNRPTSAYVIGITDQAPVFEHKDVTLKEIKEIAPRRNAIEGNLVELAAWMADHFGSTMIQALKTVLPAKKEVQRVQNRRVVLAASEETAAQALEGFLEKNQRARARLLAELLDRKEIPYSVLRNKLHVTKEVLDALVSRDLIRVEDENPAENIVRKGHEAGHDVILSDAQRTAVDEITDGMERTYLLYGVTGSGKTEVYMEAIERVVAEGGQAIVLIPEIALTYQTVMRFYHRFGERVSIMHSRLSAGERYRQFEKARNGGIDVMIGPRSALFTPLPHLRLIIIDEEQEHTYKSDSAPRYHAREVAIRRAEMEGAKVVLGSATPSLESYSRAQSGEYRLVTLPQRVEGRELAQVRIVDLREELKCGNRNMISRELDAAIRDRLEKKQQVMLFLNRRGYAGFVSCRECGHVIRCDHCDVSMSLHKGFDSNTEDRDRSAEAGLVCHYCGEVKPVPHVCPNCGSRHLGSFKAGTQQVETLLRKLYPGARILRMDLDTTREKESYTKILSAFGNREADILIGTQMIVKGHDFPGVTLVGILAADLSLNSGDFRAAERTFQLLVQAAGRAGRGEEAGEVIIQAYEPEHYAILASAGQDYPAFYEEEMKYRGLLDYPPCGHMMQVQLTGPDEAMLDTAAGYLMRYGTAYCRKYQVHVIGPAVPAISRVKDQYRKVLYYKHDKYDILVRVKNYLEAYIAINSGFDTIRIQYDFD